MRKHLHFCLSNHVSRFAILVAILFFVTAGPARVHAQAPKSFGSPNEAAEALFAAAKAKNQEAIFDILGDKSKEWIKSGDAVQDREGRDRFIKAYEVKNGIEKDQDATAFLVIGDDDFPFPIPIVKSPSGWSFDSEQGKEEILNRRIGRNELNTIEVLREVVKAQAEYASVDRDGNGILEYAQKFRSAVGKKDGLYWPVKEGEAESPLGELVAAAVRKGYQAGQSDRVTIPYFGYHYRILTAQESTAADGAYDYIVNNKMIGGFAVLAHPAKFGVSGFKTFIVNHEGVVYDTDLGKDTLSAVEKIQAFDPDSRWKKS